LRPTHGAQSRLLLDVLILELPVARPGSVRGGGIKAPHGLLCQRCITLGDVATLMHLGLIGLLLRRLSDARSIHRVPIGRYVILQEDILFLEVRWALQELQVVDQLERGVPII
jgi:hypothetical protein